ncbi:hypothetical protein HELRODRAFT_74056 [Helobdella robusta]|uniref:Dynein regulatory complex subunit 2 n=1 Tax=Helobdella robusta TaxID=6412 RepID=T1G1L9_HELRO|nr:hypothetical protein HELRODRAFT_74056 [Helobdella robusta]ESO08879.1 hypothetical protein HELRODRAFT_74056 [Helobdella robusta]
MSKRRLGRLAKMTEDQKILYLEKQRLAEEEMRRDKEELLAQYLKNKMAKEEKMSQENWYKLNQQWREILRGTKSKELKKEIEILSQVFERAVDIKSSALQTVLKDLAEAEEQFLMAKRSHMHNVDKLLDFQRRHMNQMDTDYKDQVESLKQEFESEKALLTEQHRQKVIRLEGLIFAMEDNFFEKEEEEKAEFQSNMDELKNRNLEDIHSLRLRQELLLESLWNKFLAACKYYHDATEDRKKSFDELKEKDDKNAGEMEAQAKKIENLQVKNCTTIIIIITVKIFSAKKKPKQEKEMLASSLYCLKKALVETQMIEKDRLAKLVVVVSEVQKRMKRTIEQGEHLLKAAERCRRLESEGEKILPFYQSTLDDSDLNRIEEIMKEEAEERLTKLMHSYTNLDNFWKRFNKVAVEKSALEKEIGHLTEINQALKRHIKCEIKEHFSTPDLKQLMKNMEGGGQEGKEKSVDCGLPELKIVAKTIEDT